MYEKYGVARIKPHNYALNFSIKPPSNTFEGVGFVHNTDWGLFEMGGGGAYLQVTKQKPWYQFSMKNKNTKWESSIT